MTKEIWGGYVLTLPEGFIVRNAVVRAVSEEFGDSCIYLTNDFHTIINVDGEYYTFNYKPEIGWNKSALRSEWNGRWKIEVMTVYGGAVCKRPVSATLRAALAVIVEAIRGDAAKAKAFADGVRPRLVSNNK